MRTIFSTSWRRSGCLAMAGVLILSSPASASAPDLTELTKDFRKAESPAVRIDLLQEMADEPGASPDESAAALRRGLKDDSFLVQAKAAALLGELVESETAISALLEAGQSFAKDRTAAMQMPKLDVPKLGEKGAGKKLREMQEALDAQANRLKGLVDYERELIQALLSSKDERCISVFGPILRTVPLDPYGKDVVRWLFNVGTASALEEVMDFIPATDKILKSRAKERKKLARAKPARAPRDWKGTKDAWKARESSRISGQLSRFDEVTQKSEDRLNEFGELVRDLVKKTDLAPAPVAMDSRAWLKWWRSEKPKLEAADPPNPSPRLH